jgi:hypothetical protein
MTQPPSDQESKTPTREVLERLRRLQDLDQRAAELERRAKGGPEVLDALAKAVKAVDAKIAALTETVRVFRTQIRLRETEVKATQSRLERLNDQARLVATQKEFKAISSEMANARADMRRVEDETLKLLEAVERKEKDLAALREERAKEQGKFDAEQARLHASSAGVRGERERLLAERPALRQGIPPEPLAAYERLAKTRPDAVVPADGGYCSGCMEMLTRQDVFAIQTAARVVVCKSCGRILYWQG